MPIRNKAIQSVVLGTVCSAGLLQTVCAELTPQRLQNDPVRYVTITTILGPTDIAPYYEPQPIVLQEANPTPSLPYHVLQTHDFKSGYVAEHHHTYQPLVNSQTVLALSVGAIFPTNLGVSQSASLLGNNYVYQANHPTESRVSLGVFVGQEYWFVPRFGMQLGLAYYQPTSAYAVNGTLTQAPLVPAQLTYQYKTITRQILLETKLMTTWYRNSHPYMSVGLGEAFNSVYAYGTSNPALLTKTPLYSSARNHAFTYRVGFGMDVELSPHLRMGLGYRFADLGRVNLGRAFISTTPLNTILHQTHLYAHELLGQLSYFF